MSLSIDRLMKRSVVALGASENLTVGLQRMTDCGIRHLPIVDGAGRLQGIVSQRDLVRAIDVMRTAEGTRQHLTLGDIMKRDAYKVPPSLPAHEGAAMMIEHKIGVLPVVSESNQLLGVVTESDFLEVAREALLGLDPTRRASA
jgi:CBS domain-containing protein